MNWAGVILLFGLTLARGEIFPQGKQWTYSYHALVRSGTVLPQEAYSQWDLHGKLIITAVEDEVVLQLTDLTTSMYNGPRDLVPQDMKPTPLPREASTSLSTPFVVHYSEKHAQVEGISVSSNDPLWAVNIKRGIASVLQFREDRLSSPASFIMEHGLHGQCQVVEHSVVNNTEYVYVRKVIDHSQCRANPVEWSSASPFLCPGAEEDTYSATTTREYTLGRTSEHLELRHVMSSGRMYVQPFQAGAEAQQVYQYQVYQLLSTKPATSVKKPHDLTKKVLTFEHDPKDLTQGRARVAQSNVLEQVHFLLDKLVTNLDDNSLRRDTRHLHNQVLTMLYYNSFLLDKNSLIKLYDDISIGTSYQLETKRNIFLELLPQIGTEASVHFMKELIVTGKLKNLASIKLLSVFPFYVRHHSAKLLEDMEVFLNLGDTYDSNMKHTAILSFATLVYQTFLAGGCSHEMLENYARKYFDLFSESTSYEQKMLYLQGLDNIQMGSVFSFMTSVIQNNEQSRHIRFLAVWASMLKAPSNPFQTYELYWPILIDRTQHLEMRVAAFTMLLIAQPTKSRLLTLYWYMQGEQDPNLYHFFYTTLVSLQKTTYPCYKHLGQLARHVSRFVRAPSTAQHWATGNYLLDYQNIDSSFGGMMQLFLVGDPSTGSPNVVYMTLNNYATGKNLNQAAVYLKLQGVPDHIKAMLDREKVDPAKLDKLVKLLENADIKLLSPEEIHLEMIVKVQGKSVFCHYFDSNNFKKISDAVVNLKMFLEYHMNYQSIFLPYLSEHAEPSDVGTLVLRGIVSNTVASTRGNSTSHHDKKVNSYNFDLDLRYYTYTTNFLEVYNPGMNLWHGAHKSRSMQGRFLFNGTVLIDVPKSRIRLSEERGGTEYVSMMLHSQTMTYIIGGGRTTNQLRKHCPKCSQEHVVHATTPESSTKLMEIPFEPLGTKLKAELFDCEPKIDPIRTLADVFAHHRSNSEIIPIAEGFLYTLHLVDYITYILPHRSCGISLNLQPFYDHPTELALTLDLHSFTALLPVDDDKELDSESNRVLTLTHNEIPSGNQLQYWKASLWTRSTPDMRHNDMNLTVHHVDASTKKKTLCAQASLMLPVKRVSMLSVSPAEETFAKVKAVWGTTNKDPEVCPEKGANVESSITAAISEEQKALAATAERWPYKQCREVSVGKKYTPFTVSCYLAAKEVAVYRKYTSEIKFSNMPEWFIKIAHKVRSVFGLLQRKPFADDVLEANSPKDTNVKTSFVFSAKEPRVTVQLNDKEAVLDVPTFRFLDNLRNLLHDDWNVNLGYNKICVVSPKSVWTFDNRTVAIEDVKMRKKETLVVADCSRVPKFGIFLETAANPDEVAFTMYAGGDTVTVRPGQSVLVTINDVPFTGSERSQHVSVWRLPDGAVLVQAKRSEPAIKVHYTREYLLVDVHGFFSGRLCGVCSHLNNNLSGK